MTTLTLTLYSKMGKEPSPNIIDSFLGSVKIPKIREQHRDELEAPISTEEVAQVIKTRPQALTASLFRIISISPQYSPHT